MMNQKEAVYTAVTNTISPNEEGVFMPTSEERKVVNQILFEGFRAGKISYDPEFAAKVANEKELRQYVSGLQSNWLRKDKRLNGGIKYEAKNPGSRTGSTDTVIKNMRLLLSTVTDAADRAEIQGAIDARVAELKPAKAAQVLDVTALPEALRKFAK